MAPIKVSILGAGVIGLTTALVLSRDKKYEITVIAKHMPGDYDIEYASPWAGANYLPVGKEGSNLARFERNTWPELARLASEVPEAAVHFQRAVLYGRAKDATSASGEWFQQLMNPNPWYKDVVPNFRSLSEDELKPDQNWGTTFTSVCINIAVYLPWLVGQCLKNGVTFRRRIAQHVGEAAGLHHSGQRASIVVNCTGLGAATLGGVEDKDVYPARGQTVLVRNEVNTMPSASGTDDGPTEALYIMQRAAGGGTILGGCIQKGNWESQPDLNLANRIMKRAVELCPELTDGKGPEALSVIRHGVGLRPMRQGGPRIEKDKIDGIWTVHNYGHGGYGYQSSYGSAEEAVKLVEEISRVRSRL